MNLGWCLLVKVPTSTWFAAVIASCLLCRKVGADYLALRLHHLQRKEIFKNKFRA